MNTFVLFAIIYVAIVHSKPSSGSNRPVISSNKLDNDLIRRSETDFGNFDNFLKRNGKPYETEMDNLKKHILAKLTMNGYIKCSYF